MKPQPFVATFLAASILISSAQTPPPGSDTSTIVSAGPHERVIETVTQGYDEAGAPVTFTNIFVELRSGLNRWSESDHAWVLASGTVEEINGRFVARQTQHRVLFGSTADDPEGVADVLMANGGRFRVRPLGVAYSEVRDGATVRSLFIAEVNAASPTLTAPNQVTYLDALPGADLQYDLSLAGIEQNIVLHSPLPAPAEFQLDESAVRVEVWTEVLESPTPTRVPGRVVRADGSVDADESLDFGPMWMAEGRAFREGERETDTLRVAKVWHQVDGRTFLIESVPYTELAAWTDRLEGGQASAFDRERLKEAWAGQSAQPGTRRGLPVSGIAAPIRKVASAAGAGEGTSARLAWNRPTQGGGLAGVVLDWSLLSTASNFTFKGDTTYYVSGPVTLSVTGGNKTVIEGGTVVKFTNSTSAQITISGPVDCQTDFYRPAVFTGKDDDTSGERISGSTGSPINYYGSGINVSGNTLRNLRFVHSSTAVTLSSSQTLTLSDSQFVKCQNAFVFGAQSTANIDNGLFFDLDGWATGSAQSVTVNGINLTVHDCTTLTALGANSTVTLGNSLVVEVINKNNPIPTLNESYESDDDLGVFMAVGAGSHYLAPNSTLRNAGSSDIDSGILGRLRRKTTYPPVVLTSDFTANTILSSRSLQDTDAVDLGYHYDVIDWAWSGRNLTNATLTLTNGVAVASFGTTGTTLRNGAKFVSGGFGGNLLNRLARYDTVQEQPGTSWAASGTAALSLLNLPTQPWPLPEIRLRFTDLSMLAGITSSRRYLINNSAGTSPGVLSLEHCQWRGLYLDGRCYSVYGMTVSFTNNLIVRGNLSFYQYPTSGYREFVLNCYNNLVLGGTHAFTHNSGGTAWTLKDNLFDCDSLSQGTYTLTADYNGYKSGLTSLGGTHNKTVTAPVDYQVGTLGERYYPTTGGNLSQLIDNGSRTASSAGLGSFTTRVDNQADTTTVDIGYHYVPTQPNVVVTIANTGQVPTEPQSPGGSGVNGQLTVARTGSTSSALTVHYLVSGTAVSGQDYSSLGTSFVIPIGQPSATLSIIPSYDSLVELPETVTVTLATTNTYVVGPESQATAWIQDREQPGVFTTVVSGLNRPIGIDYNPGNSSLIISENWDTGSPNTFRRIHSDGTTSVWSGIAGLTEEIKLATVKQSQNNFTLGDQYFGTGVAAKIGKNLANGNCIAVGCDPTWVTLSGEGYPARSLYLDQSGVFGGDLVVVTGDGQGGGSVWRVTGNQGQTLVAQVSGDLEGVITLPDAAATYGPWGGKIVVGAEDFEAFRTFDTSGQQGLFKIPVGGGFIQAEDLDLIVADHDLYCVDTSEVGGQSSGRILKVSRNYFSAFVGDILVTQEGTNSEGNPPRLFILHWNGGDFVVREIVPDIDPPVIQFEHVAFAPVTIPDE